MLKDSDKNNFIDQPMANSERRQAWYMATFHCKCTSSCISPQHFTVRTLCKACSCLVYNMNASQDTACPCCRMNEYWDIIGLPWLVCQCAAIVFRNPFQQRFHWHLAQLLTADDLHTSNDTSLIRSARARNAMLININTSLSNSTRMGSSSVTSSDFDMLQSRTQSIECSFQEIKNYSCIMENCLWEFIPFTM